MKKNLKRALIVLMSTVAIMGTTFSVYATNVDSNNQTKKARQFVKNNNTIIGKISAIDATNVTIQVATRKQIEKQENGQVAQNGTTQKEKPNMDVFFNLTGETKTINIASANFGNKKVNNDNTGTTDITNIKKANMEKKTYADYKVGDYVSIQTTDNTYAVAKKVNQAMFGGMRGFKGNGMNKPNRTNKLNKYNQSNQSNQSNKTQPIIN